MEEKLLQHIYTRYSTCLLTSIQQIKKILIATDGSNSENKCGGSWVISSANGNLLAHGANPYFECIQNMYLHRSEAYAILRVLLFLHKYSKYFSLQINNKITIYCDNKEIVTKIDNIRLVMTK